MLEGPFKICRINASLRFVESMPVPMIFEAC